MPTEPRRHTPRRRLSLNMSKRPLNRPRSLSSLACVVRARRWQSNHVRSPQMEKVKKSLARKHANTSEPRSTKSALEHEQPRRRRRRNSPRKEELKEAQNSDHSNSALMRLGWRRAAGEAAVVIENTFFVSLSASI